MKHVLMVLIVFATVSGCTSTGAIPKSQPPSQVKQGDTVVIVSVKRVQIPRNSWQVIASGAVAGEFAGAVIGGSAQNGALITAGAVVGGLAAPWLFAADGLEILARKQDGQQIVVVQKNDGWIPWIGQEAQLIGEGAEARIIR
jgi:outer membrane lipoprotein SlyB